MLNIEVGWEGTTFCQDVFVNNKLLRRVGGPGLRFYVTGPASKAASVPVTRRMIRISPNCSSSLPTGRKEGSNPSFSILPNRCSDYRFIRQKAGPGTR